MNKRKWLLFLFIALIPLISTAGNKPIADTTKPKHWTYKGQYNLMLNQVSFTNWATGGENAISARAMVDYHLKYKKGKFRFENTGHLAYGIAGYNKMRIQKTDDKMELSFSAGSKISKHWSFTGMFIFKSQFTNGYQYPNDSILISGFLSPAYITISLGMKYQIGKKFQLFLSPLAGKLTVVKNQALANQGAFGVPAAIRDSLGEIIIPGKHYFGQLGINFLVSFEKKIMKNTTYKTNLNVYNNYLDPRNDVRWKPYVNWSNRITFKINEYFATIFDFHMIYDPQVLFPVYQSVGGKLIETGKTTKIQYKELLGLSLIYKID